MHARLLSSVLLSLVLAGCGPALVETRLDDEEALPERYGVAAVQVVTNAQRVAPMLEAWTDVFVVDVNDAAKRYRLQASADGLLGSRVFVGALPPGRYAIYNLHSTAYFVDTHYWLNAPAPRLLGTFDVVQDRLTNLGSIVYQPLGVTGEGAQARRLYVVTRLEDQQDLGAFVATAYPDLGARAAAAPALTWAEDDGAAVRDGIVERIRNVGFGARAERLADGTVVLAGKLGRIYWRQADGTWTHADTGYTNEIGAVARLRDGYALAGERGLVLVGPALGGPWKTVRGPGSGAAVFWLRQLADGSIAALAGTRTDVQLYHVSADFGEWRSVHRVTHDADGEVFTGAGQTHAVVAGDGRVVLFADKQRVVYDPIARSVVAEEAGNYFRIGQQRDGTLVAVPGHWWSGIGIPEFSRDAGRTWERIRVVHDKEAWDGARGSLPFIADSGAQVALSRKYVRHENTGKLRGSKEHYVRRIADPASKAVSWGAVLQPGCNELLPQISDDAALYVLCEDGRVLRSTDLGSTWTEDRGLDLRKIEVPEEMMGKEVRT